MLAGLLEGFVGVNNSVIVWFCCLELFLINSILT